MFKSTPEQEVFSPRKLKPKTSPRSPNVIQNYLESQAEKDFQNDLTPRQKSQLRNKTLLQVENSGVQFTDLFEDKIISDAFGEYLKEAHTYEQLEFILTCKDKLKSIDSSETGKEMAKVAVSLYQTYIAENSEKMLNISTEEREESGLDCKIENLKKNNPPIWILDESPIKLFSHIINTVKVSLLQSHFEDFKKSKRCQTAVFLKSRPKTGFFEVDFLSLPE